MDEYQLEYMPGATRTTIELPVNRLTSVDQTHSNVELLDVELASVINVGEGPAHKFVDNL